MGFMKWISLRNFRKIINIFKLHHRISILTQVIATRRTALFLEIISQN